MYKSGSKCCNARTVPAILKRGEHSLQIQWTQFTLSVPIKPHLSAGLLLLSLLCAGMFSDTVQVV